MRKLIMANRGVTNEATVLRVATWQIKSTSDARHVFVAKAKKWELESVIARHEEECDFSDGFGNVGDVHQPEAPSRSGGAAPSTTESAKTANTVKSAFEQGPFRTHAVAACAASVCDVAPGSAPLNPSNHDPNYLQSMRACRIDGERRSQSSSQEEI